MKKDVYGKMPDGQEVAIYTLSNGTVSVSMIEYGATIVSIQTPDKNGQLADITLGFDTLEDWVAKNAPYFGATIGRVGNRIGDATFELNGKTYKVAVNTPPHQLHGGVEGFDKKLWSSEIVESDLGEAVKFSLTSPDGDQGFPGTVSVSITYILTEDNQLILVYGGTTDQTTLLNMTNHTYFNLTGDANKTILAHEVMINASKYTPVNDALIPTGELESVEGTPLDFRYPATLGSRIDQVPGGYDHNYVLDKVEGELAPIVRVVDPSSGRVLETSTDQPGIQLYTGNFLDGTIAGKSGVEYQKNTGFCLETQVFPDAPNHANFPSITLNPGEEYKHTTIYKFSIEN